jgi:hypothetical protein
MHKDWIYPWLRQIALYSQRRWQMIRSESQQRSECHAPEIVYRIPSARAMILPLVKRAKPAYLTEARALASRISALGGFK